MLASLAPASSSSSLPFAARLAPDCPFGQRYQAVIDSLLERTPIREAAPAMAEFRPLGALSLDELASIAGCAVLSAEELAGEGITPDEYRGALREQALAVQVTRYAERTRLLLGVRNDVAFALNDTAAAAIAAIMTRQGCPPPETMAFRPSPDECAEITLLSPTCEVMARITFDLRGAATPDEVSDWLERTLAGERLFDLGINWLKNPEEYGELAERVLSRLWDALVPA
jgi:hypothetical protein